MTLVVEQLKLGASTVVNGKICRIIYIILQSHKGEISPYRMNRHGESEGIACPVYSMLI